MPTDEEALDVDEMPIDRRNPSVIKMIVTVGVLFAVVSWVAGFSFNFLAADFVRARDERLATESAKNVQQDARLVELEILQARIAAQNDEIIRRLNNIESAVKR